MIYKIWHWLEGKKTYIVATIMALLNVAAALNWIEPAHLNALNAILTGLGFGALRTSVKNEVNKVEAPAELG